MRRRISPGRQILPANAIRVSPVIRSATGATIHRLQASSLFFFSSSGAPATQRGTGLGLAARAFRAGPGIIRVSRPSFALFNNNYRLVRDPAFIAHRPFRYSRRRSPFRAFPDRIIRSLNSQPFCLRSPHCHSSPLPRFICQFTPHRESGFIPGIRALCLAGHYAHFVNGIRAGHLLYNIMIIIALGLALWADI